MPDPPIQGPYMSALPTGRPPGQAGQADPMNLDQLTQDVARKRVYAQKYGPFCKSVQDRRRTIENLWLAGADCWKAKHRRQGFVGDWFNHYIPAGRRAIERAVVKTKQMLFTSPDFFEVYPMVDQDKQAGTQAEAWKNYLLWRMNRLKARSSLVPQLLRCFFMYGRAIAKPYLDFDDVPGEVWPSARVVDPFMHYVWPETASTMAQVQVCFEHTMIPYEQYNAWAQTGVCDMILESEVTRPEWPYHMTERLSKSGLTNPTDVAPVGTPNDIEVPLIGPEKLISMTEVFRRRGSQWEQIWLVWNVQGGPRCTRIQGDWPTPYRMAVCRQLPGEQYTNHLMADIEPLNVIANDQLNMTLEGQATAIFPIAAINPDLVARADSLVFGPRRKWLVAPEGLEFKSTPNLAGAGFQGVQAFMGMIDSFSSASPLSEGVPTRGMPRAGFAVSSLINLSMSDLRDVAESIEDEILTPLLQDFYRLTLTRIPPYQVARIPGSQALQSSQVTIQGLVGAYAFKWVGTLQAQDQQVRAQRMLTFIGQMAKLYPGMVQQGYKVDFVTLFQRLWREGMGERGADSIVTYVGPPPPPTPPPPKVAISLKGDIDPYTSHDLAEPAVPKPQPPQPQAPPPGPPGNAQGATPTGPGTGGAEAPAPATAEQGERQMSRQMSEGSVGETLAGQGVG